METRITFRGEVYITGKDKEDVQRKFDNLNIFSNTAINAYNANFIEVESMEDVTTHKEL